MTGCCSKFIISISRENKAPHSCRGSNHDTHGKKTRRGAHLGRRKEEEECRGLEGRDSCIVSSHAPVPAVIPALCLSLSTGDVWLLGTVARGWKLKGQRIFQTTALHWGRHSGKKMALLYSFNRRQAQFGLSRSGAADSQHDG